MRRIFRAMALAAAALSAEVALAENAENVEERTIEEVVVTATHRDTALMDTPLSITAVTAEDIEQKGIVNFQTLYTSVPGLSYRANGASYNTVSIRGLTQPGEGGPTVGVYIDNVSVTDSNTGTGISQIDGSIFDMERIEVLKGPQGTLYGESTLGGAIRYISKQPDTSGFYYGAKAEWEEMAETDDPSYLVNAMLNVPITGTLALRVTGFYRERAGFLDIAAPRSEEDVDYRDEDGFRAKFAWYPTDRLTLGLSAQKTEADYGGPSVGTIGAGFTNSELTQSDFPNGGTAEVEIYSFNLDYELDWANIEFTSSEFKRENQFAQELTPRFVGGFIAAANGLLGQFDPALAGVNPIGGAGPFGLFRRETERRTQELRVLSNNDSKWQWSAGLYYKDDEAFNGGAVSVDEPAFWFALRPGFEYARPTVGMVDAAFAPIFPNSTIESTETAVFGEVSYAFDDQWELLVGVRYTDIEKETNIFAENVTDKFISPKATLTWRPMDNLMSYFTVSQGFRPGVINSDLPGVIEELEGLAKTGEPGAQERADFFKSRLTVDGDKVLSYELGLKSAFWDDRANLTFAFYHLDWEDTLVFQPLVELTTLLAFQDYNDNLDDGAVSQGAEIAMDLALTDSWGVSFAYDRNWTAEIKGDAAGNYRGPNGEIVPAKKGNRLPNAPKYSWSISTDREFSMGNWMGNARLDWYRVDSAFNRVTNEIKTDGYHQLDARVSFFSPDSEWRISVYGANLADEVITFECNEVGCHYGKPSAVGVSVSYGLD